MAGATRSDLLSSYKEPSVGDGAPSGEEGKLSPSPGLRAVEEAERGRVLIQLTRCSLDRPLIGQLPSTVGPPRTSLGKCLNTRTRRKYAFRGGMRLVAHCGFTMHEPRLHSRGANAALYDAVILKLCACLFPSQQQLEETAKGAWGGGKEDGGRSQTSEQMTCNFLDARSSAFSGV